MKLNMSQLDGRIRVVLAVIFLAISAYLALTAELVVTLAVGGLLTTVAVIFIWTARRSSCPIYATLGLSTNKTN